MDIVIVEDEIRIREGIVKLLSKLNGDYKVIGEASDGKTGLELCQTRKPDLVITDIRMPQMDGLEMLVNLYDSGSNCKAIVLSAYSEFEYARKAMKLGVTEYLLKPISLLDFSKAIDNVSMQMAEDLRKKPKQVGTLEQIIRDIMIGDMMPDEDTVSYLAERYSIKVDQKFFLVCAYLGNAFENKVGAGHKFLKQAFSGYKEIKYVLLDSAFHKAIYMVVYDYEDGHDLERWIQSQLLKQITEDIVVGSEEIQGLEQLKTGIRELYPFMDWNISFDEGILISYPKITNVATSVCIYSNLHESQMKTAVFSKNQDKIEKAFIGFHEYFNDGKVYKPQEIKECYVRFLWAFLEVGKEAGCKTKCAIQRQAILEKIMNAKTRLELRDICQDVFGCFEFADEEKMSTHLLVRKAEGFIHEYYSQGITLDEIASRLNITPEYLGTQFHKETGMTYSTYMKNYRMAKAKELLVSTSLKLYEIADKVGYQDPKYFSKVFKETTGQLPAQYRRSMK